MQFCRFFLSAYVYYGGVRPMIVSMMPGTAYRRVSRLDVPHPWAGCEEQRFVLLPVIFYYFSDEVNEQNL